MSYTIGQTNRADFHARFGGENGQVGRLEELTPDAIDYFAHMETEESWEIVKDLGESGQKISSLFKTDLLEKSYNDLIASSFPDATDNSLAMILFHCMNDAPETLPPYARLVEGDHAVNASSLRPDSVESILIFVSHKGHIVPVYISAEQLLKLSSPELIIDGFVESIMVIGKYDKPFHVIADGKKLVFDTNANIYNERSRNINLRRVDNSERLDGREDGMPIGSQFPVTHFGPVMGSLCDLKNKHVMAISSGTAENFFSSTPGDFRNSRPNDKFNIDINGYILAVKQHGLRGVETYGYDPPKGNVDFLTQTSPERLERIPQLMNVLLEIEAVASKLEDRFKMNLIDRIYISDFNVGNAQAYFGDMEISISTGLLMQIPYAAPIVIEHEMIHSLLDSTRLQRLIYFKNYIADKFGIPLRPEPWERPSKDPFVDFITESKFFDDEEVGGHPGAYYFEFATSFTHTLLYFNRLIEKLKALPAEQRNEFIDHYINICEIFANGDVPNPITKFFERYEELFKWVRQNGIESLHSF